MTATVKVVLGNLFDGPADVIVLPCSTAGTVTGLVARTLSNYSIPHPNRGMKLGDVEIFPFEGGENIAQFVAFAASVRSDASTIEAIDMIASKLGEFSKTEASARIISVPLLGSGAGGLRGEAVVAALKSGFERTAHEDSNLIVHVLQQDVFDRLRLNRRQILGKPKDSIRVFISHTSTSVEAEEWVKQLALYLIDNGIQARLDRFHLRRGMDLPQWMCNELALAKKVVVVCDEIYKQKADGRLGGVGWETMIIQGDLANTPSDSTKYQIIVRTEDMYSGLPNYLKTKYAYHARPSDPQNLFREALVRELLDMPLDERIETGQFVL